MSRLEEIQDELAVLNGYNQLYEISYMPLLETLINESIKKYTLECVKASLEKASEEALYSPISGIVEESITNPENIVLL